MPKRPTKIVAIFFDIFESYFVFQVIWSYLQCAEVFYLVCRSPIGRYTAQNSSLSNLKIRQTVGEKKKELKLSTRNQMFQKVIEEQDCNSGRQNLAEKRAFEFQVQFYSMNNEEYIKKNIHPIFHPMLIKLLEAKPSDTTQQKNVTQHSEDSNESNDECDDLIVPVKKGGNNCRKSVSAEVFGQFNKKNDQNIRFIQKTEEQNSKIRDKLMQSFLFQALNKQQLEIVIGAMREVNFGPNQEVIRQGDDGDCMFVVSSGTLSCCKVFKPEEGEKFLKKYQPGESFGELALLYNVPRQATIRTDSQCVLYELDRETFNNIVKEASQKQREKYEAFLQKVEILSSLDTYERNQICDALKMLECNAGENVIIQGEIGEDFYMVDQGHLEVYKNVNGNEKLVFEYDEGKYFGELALINNEPRQATVRCKVSILQTNCVLYKLDKNSFTRLLGPVNHILKRNEHMYAKYIK